MAQIKLLVLVACLLAASVCSIVAQTQQSNSQAQATAVTQRRTLSPEAAQVADEIGVTSLLNKVANSRTSKSPITFEELVTRQEITEKVLTASLDVDSVNAIIDAEIEQISVAMLLDVRASVSLMKRDLAELMSSIQR